jgi:hypothetical protein
LRGALGEDQRDQPKAIDVIITARKRTNADAHFEVSVDLPQTAKPSPLLSFIEDRNSIYMPGPPSVITTRRLRGSLTPLAVGTASCD